MKSYAEHHCAQRVIDISQKTVIHYCHLYGDGHHDYFFDVYLLHCRLFTGRGGRSRLLSYFLTVE